MCRSLRARPGYPQKHRSKAPGPTQRRCGQQHTPRPLDPPVRSHLATGSLPYWQKRRPRFRSQRLKSIAEKQRDIAERRRFAQDKSLAAKELLDRSEFSAAIKMLEGALGQLPGEPNLEALLSLARAESERRSQDQESLAAKEARSGYAADAGGPAAGGDPARSAR